MAGPRSSSSSNSSLPWVSLLLALVFGLATLQAGGASEPLVETARVGLSEASRYFGEHPYLEPGAALRARLTHQRVMNMRRAYEHDREARGDPRGIAGVMRRQQAKLDGMVAEATAAFDALPARSFGLNPAEWRPWTLLSYVAMHSGVVHLAGNLLFLVLLGLYLEPAIGIARSLFVCLFGTLGAGLGFAFAQPGMGHVLIGSSGLLAGLVAVFAWELRESRKEGFYALGVVGCSVWLALPPWLGTMSSLSHPGIDLMGSPPSSRTVYWALAGGLVGAMSIYAVLGLLGGRRERATVTHSAKTSTGSVGLDDALQSRAAGCDEVAFQQLTVMLQQEPEQLDGALLLSDVARSLGRHDEADSAMLRVIRIEAKRDETSSAVRHWLDLTQREIPRSADPALLIRIAALLRHHDHPRSASEALRQALDRASGSNTAVVSSRVARAAQELDPSIAHDAAWKALGCSELTLEERQNLEDLLGNVILKLPGAELMLSNARVGRDEPAPIEVETRTRVLDLVNAVPLELDEEGLRIVTKGGKKKRILLDRIGAVAVAAVGGLSDKPVLVIDLVLNWADTGDDRLRVVRIRGDKFDPRSVLPAKSAVEAIRRLVQVLLEEAKATPLPDLESALGRPFASFEELRLYERMVLMAESPLIENDS